MSSIDAINSSLGVTGYDSTLSRIPSKVMSDDDFLRLLITELTSQNPMEPKSNVDFVSELSAISSLSRGDAMQQSLERLRADQQTLQATGLIGRTVVIHSDETSLITGMVEAVHVEAGTPKIVVGGQTYDLGEVTSILQSDSAN